MYTVRLMSSLGSQIRRYRTTLGWTLEQLSELSDVDVGTISALEKRNSTRSQFGPALARAFGLTLEQLLDTEQLHLDTKADGTYVVRAKSAGPRAAAPVSALASARGAWPFESVSEQDWRRLGERDRLLAETYVRALVDAARAHSKRQANASRA
ncbi:helix-turn-helix domain-containing protein [Pseudacidovorax sp. RU35E]|uniref:helix-turn-helix domain-containing protein n=1 Tax=Pseudacidovorax sp. RU35E TaxID=1907403 RepID=UPI0009568246|nr:helix-turn-helix domain-containing protein [Pseudacidovorax sp. RU35E]SIQ00680.1 DNA-binding transcriptional regulator, XRE-family HTH domain [Pseudacidovorax sp. RU35E]